MFISLFQSYSGDEELCCVYVPTNHLYIGDIFLVNTKDVIWPTLSVREGIGKLSTQSWIVYGRISRLLITTFHSISGMSFFYE